MRVALRVLGFVTATLIAGCGADTESNRRAEQRPVDCSRYGSLVDLSAEPRYSADYLHRWTTREGCPVRLDVIMTRQGADACGGERVADILMGWPLGESHARHRPSRIFVRDPNGVVADRQTSAAVDADAELPEDAVDTGYRQDGRALWMRPDDGSFVYLVSGDRVEAWPHDPIPSGCA